MRLTVCFSLTVLAAFVALMPKASKAEDWGYFQSKDEMRDIIDETACIPTSTPPKFDFPYQTRGGSRVELCITYSSNQEQYVSLTVKPGQFLCHSRDCNVLTKIDSGKSFSMKASTNGDGSYDMIFIDNGNSMFKKIAASYSVIMQVDFYKYGGTVLKFNTLNLREDFKKISKN